MVSDEWETLERTHQEPGIKKKMKREEERCGLLKVSGKITDNFLT